MAANSRERGDARVRPAGPSDAAACARIYAHYVRETAITFEEVPPGAQEMAERIALASRHHVWLVLEDAEGVWGYAYGARLHPRAAYRWSCETSVYIDVLRRGEGGGKLLYAPLLNALEARGYRMAVAGITLPNDASEALHAAFGFERVGAYRRIGFKHGAWHDVLMLQRPLGAATPPAELV